MKLLLTSLPLFFLTTASISQTQEPEMADMMRSEGKIYVVVAIILIILAGLFIYLFTLDRKMRRLENQTEKKA